MARRPLLVFVKLAVGVLVGAGVSSAVVHAPGPVGKIAFARGCSIFVTATDGGGERRLTRPRRGCDGTPSWSPDGRRIAFVRRYDDPTGQDRAFPGEVYVVNADGAVQGRITGRAPNVGDPRWSPNGQAIAFDVGVGGAGIVNADGSHQRVLAPSLRYPAGPSWSPDGRLIAVVRRLDAGIEPKESIHTVTASGRSVRRLTVAREGQHLSPAWSPKGSTITFTRLVCAYPKGFCGAEIRSVSPRGSGDKLLVRIPGPVNPRTYWSPDGTRMLIDDGRAGIWIMRADGTHQRALVRYDADTPTWSPDARRIAFTRPDFGDGGSNPRIVVMDADGTGARTLARGHAPAWQPTG